jgi:hypothetical protein
VRVTRATLGLAPVRCNRFACSQSRANALELMRSPMEGQASGHDHPAGTCATCELPLPGRTLTFSQLGPSILSAAEGAAVTHMPASASASAIMASQQQQPAASSSSQQQPAAASSQ